MHRWIVLTRITVAMFVGSTLAGAVQVQAATRDASRGVVSDVAGKRTRGVQTGIASVYSDRLRGRKTASGQRYRRDRMTAAHKTLPMGTRVKVTNTENGMTAIVVVNDRGPVPRGRILDLSPRAAEALGIDPKATAHVRLEVVGAQALKPET